MAPRLGMLMVLCLGMVGCAEVERAEDWAELVRDDYLPEPSHLPDGLAEKGHRIGPVPGSPADYEEGSVERLSSDMGWAIYTRTVERPFVSAPGSVHDRSMKEPRVVVYTYRRREGTKRGELEMAAWIRHADSKKYEVIGSSRLVMVVVEDGGENQVISSGYDWLRQWFKERSHGTAY